MKLYNQTANNLRFDIGGKVFSCDPYGDLEVQSELVEHIKARGVPLSVSPVTPEVRAAETIEAASDAARKDEIANLNKQLTEAVAGEKSVKSELEKSLADLALLEQDKAGLSLELSQLKDKYKKVSEDMNALNRTLEEQAKELAIKKEELERAKAVIAEVKKTEEAKKTAVVSNQPKNK